MIVRVCCLALAAAVAGCAFSLSLGPEEAARLADQKAGALGYNLADYQRWSATYETQTDCWSFRYDRRHARSSGNNNFYVRIEVKTRKAHLSVP
jgi:hypothetical protein